METRSLQYSNPRRKRSFTLSSFRKLAGDQKSAESTATAAQERSHLTKAAAWQWYTRGVGEVVVPTKRPPPGAGGNEALKGLVQPPAADTRKAASRFKAEASARTTPAGRSPLYDEVELSGLKTHMVEFVQRVQKKDSDQKKAAKPLHTDPASAAPAGNYGSTQHLHPPGKGSAVRRSNSGSVEGSGFRRPMQSALQKLFRKVMMALSFLNNNSEAVQEPEAPPDESNPENMQYHYHHYIHHHHHHYHYGGPSPEEAEFIRRRRHRHSESSGLRPWIPSLIGEEIKEVSTEEEEVESPLSAFIPRPRRHSDSVFAEHNAMKAIDFEGAEWADKEPVKIAGLQLPRRYSSDRFTSENEVPYMGMYVESGEQQWQAADIKSRRRHSTENSSERDQEENVRRRLRAATEEAKAKGGGEDGGGVYKLGGGCVYGFARRGKSESFGITSRSPEENVELMYGGREFDSEEKDGLRTGHFTPSPASARRCQGSLSPLQPAACRKRQPRLSSLPTVNADVY